VKKYLNGALYRAILDVNQWGNGRLARASSCFNASISHHAEERSDLALLPCIDSAADRRLKGSRYWRPRRVLGTDHTALLIDKAPLLPNFNAAVVTPDSEDISGDLDRRPVVGILDVLGG
jgi:hypothetical protein